MSHKHLLHLPSIPKTQNALVFLATCAIVWLIGVALKIDFAWALCLGVAYMYPYPENTTPIRYFSEIAALAVIYALEILIIKKTGIIEFILKQYRGAGIDSHVVSAACVVLLLTPIINLITTYILKPLLENKISVLGMKILAGTFFGIFCAILNKIGFISFIVEQSRALNLDAYLLTLICITLILAPINNLIVHFSQQLPATR